MCCTRHWWVNMLVRCFNISYYRIKKYIYISTRHHTHVKELILLLKDWITAPCSQFREHLTCWMNIVPPSLGSKSKPRPAEAQLIYFPTLRMEAICSLGTLGCLQTTTLQPRRLYVIFRCTVLMLKLDHPLFLPQNI
jgi:hypothetical protein